MIWALSFFATYIFTFLAGAAVQLVPLYNLWRWGDCDEQPWLGPIHRSSYFPIWRVLTNFLKVCTLKVQCSSVAERFACLLYYCLLWKNLPCVLHTVSSSPYWHLICQVAWTVQPSSLRYKTSVVEQPIPFHGEYTTVQQKPTHGEYTAVQHNPPMENARLCNTTHPRTTHGCDRMRMDPTFIAN